MAQNNLDSVFLTYKDLLKYELTRKFGIVDSEAEEVLVLNNFEKNYFLHPDDFDFIEIDELAGIFYRTAQLIKEKKEISARNVRNKGKKNRYSQKMGTNDRGTLSLGIYDENGKKIRRIIANSPDSHGKIKFSASVIKGYRRKFKGNIDNNLFPSKVSASKNTFKNTKASDFE